MFNMSNVSCLMSYFLRSTLYIPYVLCFASYILLFLSYTLLFKLYVLHIIFYVLFSCFVSYIRFVLHVLSFTPCLMTFGLNKFLKMRHWQYLFLYVLINRDKKYLIKPSKKFTFCRKINFHNIK